MKLDRLTGEAQANLRELAVNPYPGRGIVIGMAPGGEPVQTLRSSGAQTISGSSISSGGLRPNNK
ncbi:MAG: hypothetical protein O7D96_06070 [SAR324 cluster bacterium]|nr:hypothetical protein [SAR324 cluster bacterium]